MTLVLIEAKAGLAECTAAPNDLRHVPGLETVLALHAVDSANRAVWTTFPSSPQAGSPSKGWGPRG